MRARIAVYYSQQQVELREVVLKDKPPQLLTASPKGTVPVLVSSEGVIEESIEIMQWALERSDPQQWLSAVDGDLLANALVRQCDLEFKPVLDKYKYFDRYPEQSQAFYFNQALPFLKILDEKIKSNVSIGSTQAYLGGDSFGVLDAAIFPFIRQFAFSDKLRFDELTLTHLQAWLELCLNVTLFKNVMKKYPKWSLEEGNSVIFGQGH